MSDLLVLGLEKKLNKTFVLQFNEFEKVRSIDVSTNEVSFFAVLYNNSKKPKIEKNNINNKIRMNDDVYYVWTVCDAHSERLIYVNICNTHTGRKSTRNFISNLLLSQYFNLFPKY
jgi:hypothetical protein